MLSKRTNWDDTLKAASTGDYARIRDNMHRIFGQRDNLIPEAVEDTALQTRLESLTEALINIAIGFFINFWGNWFILPLVGFTTLTVKDNFVIGLLFTVISVARQYAIRRWAQQHLRRAKIVTATYLNDLWQKFLAA